MPRSTMEDPEGEISPVSLAPASASHSGTVVPERNVDSIREHAEEFVVEWMAGAVQKAKGRIVEAAMKKSRDILDASEFDKAIIEVISRWDFWQNAEWQK